MSFGLFSRTYGQKLVKETETSAFTDYVLTNNQLRLGASYQFMVPYQRKGENFHILEQEVVTQSKPGQRSLDKVKAWNLGNSDQPVVELVNPGMHRGREVATLIIHVSRQAKQQPNRFLITKRLKVRVFKNQESNKKRALAQNPSLVTQTSNSPLAEGNWYKIPITKNGIYKLDRDYLNNLGINTGSIDPKKIQIWTSRGYPLPQLNSAPRDSLTQIPILVRGESDGSFDNGNEVLFYGNSPNPLIWDADNEVYTHKVHPYSTKNYVFLTIGDSDGMRLNTANNNLTATRNIQQFTDFLWKEQELYKTEQDIKSGREWFGQKFSTEPNLRNQTILQDTIPGFIDNDPVQVKIRMLSRSIRSTTYNFQFNNQTLQNLYIGPISAYNSAEGLSARYNVLNQSVTVNSADGRLNILANFNYSDPSSTGFVDWIELTFSRTLTANNGYLYFFAPRDGQQDEVGSYQLNGFSSQPLVMDITNPLRPKLLNVSGSGKTFQAAYYTDPNRRFVAQTRYFTPGEGTKIENQNLHGINNYPDYVIVTNQKLDKEARELASYHEDHDGFTTVVANQADIFNEFSAGVPDPVAIRDYLKFLYDRAAQSGHSMPKYLLFLGDTSFDYKGIDSEARMNNLVFTYESEESIDRIGSFGSDDFFGLLDDNEGEWSRFSTNERIDIGIGRIPVETESEAQSYIEKVKTYNESKTLGNWRNLFTFAADDDVSGSSNDSDLHVLNADGTIQELDENEAGIRFKKIYELTYPVENTASGRRIPQATHDFISSINNGTLLINYSGHGAEQQLSGERLFNSDYISQLTNKEKPTIFVTATCSFGRYDDIEAQSGAEKLVLYNQGGAIAAFTTTRTVYTSSSPTGANNFGLNIQLSQEMIRHDNEGRPQYLGDIYRKTKNTSAGAGFNSRKFILLGDPGIRIGLPSQKSGITQINNFSNVVADTTLQIRALDKVHIEGILKNASGDLLPSLNGEINVTVYDGSRNVQYPDRPWLPNCYLAGCEYSVQNDILFSGRSSVKDGHFSSDFIVPKDINHSTTNGRILLYAQSDGTDAGGAYAKVKFQGINPDAANDNKGPQMDVYLNDERFVNGNLVSDSPKLIVKLSDDSGINTTGTGVGHEILAMLNTKPEKTIVLNDFYTSKLNDFTSGRVEYPLNNLPEGHYKLKVRAWDVHNNPSEKEISFEVADSKKLMIKNIYNYPNPMNNFTKFIFEHNQPGNMLDVSIRIFTLSGRPVTKLKKTIISSNSYASVEWDGRDRDHDRLANGTYIYVVHVKAHTAEGTQTEQKIEKLVILQ